jgi:thioesterase domain-containing protein/acyl carrier protein
MSSPPTEISEHSVLRSAADIRSYIIGDLSRSLEVEPASIDPDAPLESLGVGSLMALGIAGGLAAWLDRDVPATLMWDYPTINAIAERLATTKAAAPVPSGVITLQPDGDGAPIFCFPGLGGNPMMFVSLASKLGTAQPVFGVVVPGLDGVSASRARVEEIAAEMLQNIRKVRPTGPYWLAGYSFGGLLAYEAARLLVAAGEKVSMLAIYDTFTPAGRVSRPRWQRFFVHVYLLVTGKSRLKDVLGKFKWSHLRRKLSNSKPEFWIGSGEVDADQAAKIWNLNSEAAARYQPLPYPGSVIWFRAGKRALYNYFYKLNPSGGWDELARGGVRIVQLKSHHIDLLSPEHAEDAAAGLRPFLADKMDS